MAISTAVSGTWAAATTQSPTVTIPAGYQAGDLGILVSAWKAYNVTATVNQSWTEVIDLATGSTVNGNGTGSLRLFVAYKELSASETNPTITRSGTVSPGAQVIVVLRKGSNETWDVAAVSTAVESSAQNFSHAITTGTAIQDGDWVFALTGVADESATFTRGTTAISGAASWSDNIVEYPATHLSSTSGNDIAADLIYRVASTGAASGGTVTVTGSLSATERTGSVLFRVGVDLLPLTATGTATLSAPSVAGTANAADALSATGTATLQPLTVTGEADAAIPAVSTGTATLRAPTVTGAAEQTVAATGTATLRALTVTGIGDFSYSSTGTANLRAPTVTGAGDLIYAATGTATLRTLAVSGEAVEVQPAIASGTATIAAATVDGSGTQTHEATGAVVLAVPTMDGTGAIVVSGTGTVSLPGVSVAGTGAIVPALTATGEVVLGGVTVAGVADNGAYIPPTGVPGGYGRRLLLQRPQPQKPTYTGAGTVALTPLRISGGGRSSDDERVLEWLLGLSDDALIGVL